MDKAIDTKVDTGVKIVKCVTLLHDIIIDVEDFHEFSSKRFVAVWMQMAVLSSKIQNA
jgi:hypothetical protein